MLYMLTLKAYRNNGETSHSSEVYAKAFWCKDNLKLTCNKSLGGILVYLEKFLIKSKYLLAKTYVYDSYQ